MKVEKAPAESGMIIFLIAATQFINILEFMIVMPLGPDFAKDLGIPSSHLGYIGGSYTAAAAISGIVSSFFLERFDRRKAISTLMFGLVFATSIAGLAFNLETLLLARVLAGVFGGPASAVALAIIADTIPPEKRGKAMGTVMGAFSLASVIGVPIGLELARLGGWRTPFFAISLLGIVVVILSTLKLPPLTFHLQKQAGPKTSFFAMVKRPAVLLSYAMTVFTMLGLFMVIPNLAAYLQGNLNYPREHMSWLYFFGGLASLASMRFVGRFVDRYGAPPVAIFGTTIISAVLYFGFVNTPPEWSVILIFVTFMMCSAFRNIPFQVLTSQVPYPTERARFMASQSSIQHLSSAAGAMLSSIILVEGANHSLENMNIVALISLALSVTMPFFMLRIQKLVRLEQAKLQKVEPESQPITKNVG